MSDLLILGTSGDLTGRYVLPALVERWPPQIAFRSAAQRPGSWAIVEPIIKAWDAG